MIDVFAPINKAEARDREKERKKNQQQRIRHMRNSSYSEYIAPLLWMAATEAKPNMRAYTAAIVRNLFIEKNWWTRRVCAARIDTDRQMLPRLIVVAGLWTYDIYNKNAQ